MIILGLVVGLDRLVALLGLGPEGDRGARHVADLRGLPPRAQPAVVGRPPGRAAARRRVRDGPRDVLGLALVQRPARLQRPVALDRSEAAATQSAGQSPRWSMPGVRSGSIAPGSSAASPGTGTPPPGPPPLAAAASAPSPGQACEPSTIGPRSSKRRGSVKSFRSNGVGSLGVGRVGGVEDLLQFLADELALARGARRRPRGPRTPSRGRAAWSRS